MTRFDDILIERIASPLAGWLQHRFGLGQWRLSLECLNGSTAFYVAAVALEIGGKGPEDGIFVTMLRALGWLLVLEWVRRRAHRQAASSIGIQSARLGEWMFRLVLAIMLPVSLCYAHAWHNLLYSASLGLLVCHFYFKASDAPPPAKKGRRLAFQQP